MNRRTFLQWSTRGIAGALLATTIPTEMVWPDAHPRGLESDVLGFDSVAAYFARAVHANRKMTGYGVSQGRTNSLLAYQIGTHVRGVDQEAVMLTEHWTAQFLPDKDGILERKYIDHAALTMAEALDRRKVRVTVAHAEQLDQHITSVVTDHLAVAVERDRRTGIVSFYVLGGQ